MIKSKIGAVSCLATAVIVATMSSLVFVGLGQMSHSPPELPRTPLWLTVAIVVVTMFGLGVGLAAFAVGESHRRMVVMSGVLATVLIYLLLGVFWGFWV